MVSHTKVSHGVQWTTERRAVGTDRPASAASQGPIARRTPSRRSAQVPRRHSLDSVDGRAVEGATAHVRQFEHVLATAAAVDEDGTLLALWRAFLADLNDVEKVRWDECFGDGSFAPAKKGAPGSDRPRRARAPSGCFWSMARVFRWEHTWTRPVRARRNSSSARSPRSR